MKNISKKVTPYENQNLSDRQTAIDLKRFYMISGFEGEQKNKSNHTIKIPYM